MIYRTEHSLRFQPVWVMRKDFLMSHRDLLPSRECWRCTNSWSTPGTVTPGFAHPLPTVRGDLLQRYTQRKFRKTSQDTLCILGRHKENAARWDPGKLDSQQHPPGESPVHWQWRWGGFDAVRHLVCVKWLTGCSTASSAFLLFLPEPYFLNKRPRSASAAQDEGPCCTVGAGTNPFSRTRLTRNGHLVPGTTVSAASTFQNTKTNLKCVLL